ncbi:MAG TPA: 2'-5' RNA ligase family protein [Bosea sp. (in: a-proteobacteria)]|jgi:2'-5' RNA ligase|uniref:2'-5' RNA ligase family protein n=1 Tax=Bosea sp. (in: a-proteobacteria) TaxID=1871050 RepID=UPI002DDD0CA5|nr:2'-5' RNA ligase family protein [Bosea sp. (in: a-proteobacteria)]HEV2554452.1 2'-5' RNA ligase family protein [Bosea sp. (in: a-proteobacteria)]
MDDAPLILTLRFDETSFARFDAERRLHFPPAHNHIPAHLTLFHHLPSDRHGEITDGLASVGARQAPFHLTVSSLRFLGQGTAYVIDSPELQRLRAEIAGRWSAHLTRQDAEGFRPHVTIQNKTAAATAKALFEKLSTSFEPFEVLTTGFLLWRYRGGPWEPAGEHRFIGSALGPESARRETETERRS